MHSDGDLTRSDSGLSKLVAELRVSDCVIDQKTLKQIISYGDRLVPYLEEIVQEALEIDPTPALQSQRDSEFAVVHALYLLSQLRSEQSLDLILKLLSQKQAVLDYWVHDLVQDDIWEVIFHLGQNRLDRLEAFILNHENNIFSRLAIATTLVQLAIYFDSKRPFILETFKKLLLLEDEEPDFVGLIVSELLDLGEPSLRPYIQQGLRSNEVWSGIITEEEVDRSLTRKRKRRLYPLGIFERYKVLRQNPYIRNSAPATKSKFVQNLRSHNLL